MNRNLICLAELMNSVIASDRNRLRNDNRPSRCDWAILVLQAIWTLLANSTLRNMGDGIEVIEASQPPILGEQESGLPQN